MQYNKTNYIQDFPTKTEVTLSTTFSKKLTTQQNLSRYGAEQNQNTIFAPRF